MNPTNEDTTIEITNEEPENEPVSEFSSCDYMCFIIQICVISGLIYILMSSFYFLFRIIEAISNNN